SLDLSNFDTTSVTDLSGMFQHCSNLSTIYVGDDWETENVAITSSMFGGCTSLPNFNSSVVDKTNAHYGEGGYLTYKGN
ncbi:MAG: BspA family leucine-rich repeat surface protein, partial [Clostridia bacterium]|nr:BspA family leucine-rich repeat surface protein [Clostridia bacterium]